MTGDGGLIGRTDEMERLDRALARAVDGQPSAVLVGGEAGIGKTSLVRAFAEEIADRATVLTGGCFDVAGNELSYAPFTGALRGLVAERGAEAVLDLVPSGAAPVLGTILPTLGAEPAVTTDRSRTQLFEAVLDLLARLARERPCVLLVEDAQWADRSSRELLDFLLRSLTAAPGLLLVVTHRTGDTGPDHPWQRMLSELRRQPWVDPLDLGGLDAREVVDLARALLGPRADLGTVAEAHRRGAGNPLFVEALLRASDRATEGLPEDLADLLLAQVRALPPDAARVVDVAAVAGPRVGHGLLAAVLEELAVDSALDLDRAARAAVDARILVTDPTGYAFRHALIRDAVHQRLLPGERSAAHAAYAHVLRDRPELGDGSLQHGTIAHHLAAVPDPAGAVAAAHRAADEARRATAYAEELDLLRRVLTLWPSLPEPGIDRFEVLTSAVEAARRCGEHRIGAELASEALGLLDPDQERVRTAQLLERRGAMRAALGDDDAAADYEAAVAAAPSDHPIRASLLNTLAAHQMNVPLPEEASRTAGEALELARSGADGPAEAAALTVLAVLEARRGRLDENLPRFAEARRVALASGAPEIALRAWHHEANLMLAFGRLSEARSLARAGLDAAREAGLSRSLGPGLVVIRAAAEIDQGDGETALASIDAGLWLAPGPNDHAHLLGLRAALDLEHGRLDEAEEVLAHLRDLVDGRYSLTTDRLLVARLEIATHLAARRYDDALGVLAEVLDHRHLDAATRYLWPVLTVGAEVVQGARASAEHASHADRVAISLVARAGELPTPGPVQSAWRSTFAALVAEDAGDLAAAVGEWRTAVAAWTAVDRPLPRAQAEVRLAAALLAAGGDRAEPGDLLRRAAATAERLGAAPLRGRVTDLARRGGVALDGTGRRRGSPDNHGLTARELEILRLVADGRSNAEIAAELYIAPKTASVHVSHILTKLGVANRVEAAAAARRLDLLA